MCLRKQVPEQGGSYQMWALRGCLITSDNICHIKYISPRGKHVIKISDCSSCYPQSDFVTVGFRTAESVLQELARVRDLFGAFQRLRNDSIGPMDRVIGAPLTPGTAVALRLRYCLHLHSEAWRAFAQQHHKNLRNWRNPKHERHAGAAIITRRNSVRRCGRRPRLPST
jgi:hypothetical protein